MAKTVRPKTQAQMRKVQTLALKKLRELDLISSRIDLRKRPTKHALRQIAKFEDVLTGKAVALQPANPKTFKGLYPVKGKVVIIPRRKGEKIGINKKGEIVGKRKVGKRVVGTVYKATTPQDATKNLKGEKKQYAIPLTVGIRPTRTFWFRASSMKALRKFLAEYKDYKTWKNYVVEETVSAPLSDAQLNSIIAARGYTVEGYDERMKRLGRTPKKRVYKKRNTRTKINKVRDRLKK